MGEALSCIKNCLNKSGDTSSPQCPQCPTCEVCDNRTYLKSGHKTIHTFRDIPGIEIWEYELNSKEEMERYFGEIIEDMPRQIPFVFSLIAMDTPTIEDVDSGKMTKLVHIMIPYPVFPLEISNNGGLMYNRKSDYEKLKTISNKLNEIIKKYPSLYVPYIQAPYDLNTEYPYMTLASNDPLLNSRYDSYQSLIQGDETLESLSKSINATTKLIPEEFTLFPKFYDEGRTGTHVDVRLIGIISPRYNQLDKNDYAKSLLETLTAEQPKTTETFISSGSIGGCVCAILLLAIAIGFIIFIAVRGRKMANRSFSNSFGRTEAVEYGMVP